MTIRAVVFDAYGTIFDVYSVAVLAEQLFPGQGVALANLWRDKQIDYTRLRTLSSQYRPFSAITEDALVFALARLGLSSASTARTRLMAQYDQLAVFADVKPVLQRLRDAGMPLAILSNGDPPMLETVVAHAGLADCFDHVLSADSVRRFKTAPEVYRLAVDAFGAAADQLAFVSSNGWDACGATWYGFRTFWINRLGLPAEELGVTPHASGRSMTGVVDFVQS